MDSRSTTVTRHDYLPFGEELTGSSPGTDVEQRFTGQIRDTETGLDFFNARYYTAPLGRFNSVDPENAGADLRDPQTWNEYAYARNNPFALVDPTGMDPEPTDPVDPGDGFTLGYHVSTVKQDAGNAVKNGKLLALNGAPKRSRGSDVLGWSDCGLQG